MTKVLVIYRNEEDRLQLFKKLTQESDIQFGSVWEFSLVTLNDQAHTFISHGANSKFFKSPHFSGESK